jgi:DNA-binding CsgD family transcriptional regulator
VNHQAYLDVATSNDRPTFQRRLVDFADKLGFPLVSAVLVIERPSQPVHAISVDNVPKDFQASYDDVELSRQSPVLKRLRVLSHPFVYDQAMYVQDGAGPLWEHQAAHGYRSGIAMAMHMPNGRHFLLGVDRSEPLPTDDAILARMMADLQLLGAFAQETAVRLLTPLADAPDTVPVLSARELEVLKWTSAGKSAGVIADLLAISVATVNWHLRRAEEKLGVAGKHAAVVKALKLGLL